MAAQSMEVLVVAAAAEEGAAAAMATELEAVEKGRLVGAAYVEAGVAAAADPEAAREATERSGVSVPMVAGRLQDLTAGGDPMR
mmetsp:Transcript_45863/g.99769  ORF Transcript_45863/g.99769 Transcript_45863/m.99769 type:complete len:84 (+) Transcript_45863:743-994(+)